MKKFYFGMTIDDVALADWSTTENFNRLIEFLHQENVKATCFIVPIDEETDRPFSEFGKEYIPLIRDAVKSGFAVGQHGLRHNRFEFGIPPSMVLDLPHEIENKRYAMENKEFLERDHSTENCRARLRQGRTILQDALELPVDGFRAPALQESPGMFAALKEEGYLYDSSLCLQETGWDYILDNMDVPPRRITRERWENLKQRGQGLTLPLTCDYTWYVTKEKYARTMELAKHDLQACIAADVPFIALTHVNPVFEGEGIPFLHELFALARSEAAKAGIETEFTTLNQISGVFCK